MKAKRDVKGLIKALNYKKDDSVRRKAAWALGLIGDKRAVKPLVNALKDEDRGVREAAVRALGKIGGPAVNLLTQALKDKEWEFRMSVIEALRRMGESAIDPLIQGLEDGDSDLRNYSAVVLGLIGDEKAAEPLTKALNDENREVQEAAKEALQKIKAKES